VVFILPISLLITYYGFDFAYLAFEIGEKSGDPGGLYYRFIIKSIKGGGCDTEGFIHFLRFLAYADTAVFCHYQLGYLSIVLVGTNFAIIMRLITV
jgi:hypothetical protein